MNTGGTGDKVAVPSVLNIRTLIRKKYIFIREWRTQPATTTNHNDNGDDDNDDVSDDNLFHPTYIHTYIHAGKSGNFEVHPSLAQRHKCKSN